MRTINGEFAEIYIFITTIFFTARLSIIPFTLLYSIMLLLQLREYKRYLQEQTLAKLGLAFPQIRHWYRKLFCFFKIYKNKQTNQLLNLIPTHYSKIFKQFLKIFKYLNSLYDCHNAKVIKFIIRLRMNLRHFQERKFKQIFSDSSNPMSKESCSNFASNIKQT